MIKKFKMLTIKNKFFFSMMLSSTLVILILMITTTVIYCQNYIRQETASSQKQLEYTAQQLDFFLSSVENYSKTIISDPLIQNACSASRNPQTYNLYNASLLVKDELNHIIQSTKYIHAVTLYDVQKKYLFSTENSPQSTNPEYMDKTPFIHWASTEKTSRVNTDIKIKTLSLIRPFFSFSTGEHLGYLEISIPESSIADIYRKHSTDSNSIFIIDKYGIVQSTADVPEIGSTYNDFQDIVPSGDFDSHFSTQNITFTKYFSTLDWYIVNCITSTVFLQSIYMSVGTCIGVAVLLIAIYIMLAHRLATTITSPLHKLIEHTKTIKEGNWKTISDPADDRDMKSLFEAFNSMITAQENYKNELVEAQKSKDKISLDLLQQQVNPHFLYNTLDNICSLAELDEKEHLIHLVMNLSTFYRKGLSNGKTTISVKEELELVEAYLDILRIRYLNKFEYAISCPDTLYSYTCLKLLLQPIVENSIYHGIKELPYKGVLNIQVSESHDCLTFVIRDNGVGLPPNAEQQIWGTGNDHFGIKNIHQRIQLYYGTQYGLTIYNHTDGGCITSITIGKETITSYANEYINS